MNYEVVGIGNALVDILARVDDAFLEKMAVAKGGMTLSSLEDQNKVLAALSGQALKISSGGSAANTMHGLGVLGGRSYYLGRVANDSYGHHYTEDMRLCGVGFPGPGAEAGATGTSVILITPDSQRTMITHLGVSACLHPDNVDETITRAAKMVYIEGYLWTNEVSRAAAVKMAETAKAGGIPVAFTLSDAFVAKAFMDGLIEFIRWHVDILFCNEAEAMSLTLTPDAGSAFTALLGMAETVFLTRSASGSLAGSYGKTACRIKAFPAAAVDSTGAGDLYAAGALSGLLRGRPLEESAIIGSYCAAQVVSHVGARLPVHAHTEAARILRDYAAIP